MAMTAMPNESPIPSAPAGKMPPKPPVTMLAQPMNTRQNVPNNSAMYDFIRSPSHFDKRKCNTAMAMIRKAKGGHLPPSAGLLPGKWPLESCFSAPRLSLSFLTGSSTGTPKTGKPDMRLGGRLAAAIEILEDIERRHRPAADALKDWGLSHRFAGSGDRAAIGNIVYDALRRKRSAAWLFDSDAPRALGFGALVLEWKETPESLNAALEGDKFGPEPLGESEVKSVASRTLDSAPEPVRADCPDWCVPLLEGTFGPAWVTEAKGLAERPPLDLRVNAL